MALLIFPRAAGRKAACICMYVFLHKCVCARVQLVCVDKCV